MHTDRLPLHLPVISDHIFALELKAIHFDNFSHISHSNSCLALHASLMPPRMSAFLSLNQLQIARCHRYRHFFSPFSLFLCVCITYAKHLGLRHAIAVPADDDQQPTAAGRKFEIFSLLRLSLSNADLTRLRDCIDNLLSIFF
jgi:hypothetical protein